MFLRAAMSAACLLVADAAIAQAGADTPGQGRSRLFVLTDIENEPDDTQSLIRLLLYSNEIDIEGPGLIDYSEFKQLLEQPETSRLKSRRRRAGTAMTTCA